MSSLTVPLGVAQVKKCSNPTCGSFKHNPQWFTWLLISSSAGVQVIDLKCVSWQQDIVHIAYTDEKIVSFILQTELCCWHLCRDIQSLQTFKIMSYCITLNQTDSVGQIVACGPNLALQQKHFAPEGS